MQGLMPECLKCKHFINDPNRNICTAFPDGIPNAIMASMISHTEPYPGDDGIQFEPIDDDEEES